MLKQIIQQSPVTPETRLPRPQETSPLPTAAPPSMPAPARAQAQGKNVLSSDVQITGNLKFTSDLLVDGSIDGEVNSEGNLTLGENGRIKGDVRAKSITIFGKISGNVNVTGRCVLMSSAELIGDIRASMLSIEEGAVFMGASTVGRAPGAKA